MSEITINGANLGNQLQDMLMCDGIQPGVQSSYELCRNIYLWHPMGAKIVERPVKMAQSQKRDITIAKCSLDRVKEAFLNEWSAVKADNTIFNFGTQ